MREFRIPKKVPKIPTSTNKSIRFPNTMIEQVEEAIRGTDCTFSAFVVESVRMSLQDLAEQKEKQQQNESQNETDPGNFPGVLFVFAGICMVLFQLVTALLRPCETREGGVGAQAPRYLSIYSRT